MTDKKSSGLHWFSPTFMRPGLALAAVGVFSLGALQWSVHAQAPAAKDINPPVDNCNKVVEDTLPDPSQPTDPKRRIARKIGPELLTSGQPCAQIASGLGLLIDNSLGNRQRSFDYYSWLTFLALNSPADGKTIGQGPRPGGDAATKWESVSNYRQLADVMLDKGVKPTWGERIVPDACKALDAPDKMIVKLGEAAWNQPFKTGPLIDQNGNYAVFDILMNQPMFDFIDQNGLYSKQGQERFDNDVVFPLGNNPVSNATDPTKNAPGRMGAVMIKVSWRILDPEKDKALMAKFHTVDALIYFPGPPATKTGPTCVAKTLGLIGFHVGHKTQFAEQWAWTTFEHVANAPDEEQVAKKTLQPPYSFYNPGCPTCPVNQTPPDPWDPPASLKFPTNDKSQVVRIKMLPGPVLQEVADLNRQFRALLKGTVWENYMLLATQWPAVHDSKTDCNGSPAPTYLANTTLETYSQGRVPLASSSCMACHGNATTQHVPATPSDFTFILEKAQCENGTCGAPVTGKRPAQALRCGLAGQLH
jgi:hypothetical protein